MERLSKLRRAAAASALAVFLPAAATAQTWNAELLCNFTHGTGRDVYAAVWGYTAPDGTELAILGTVEGTAFVDVTNPRQPIEVEFVRGAPSTWREMQTHSHYCYIVTEGGGGMQIVDLANPHAPQHVADFDSTFNTAHTIHIRDGFAWVNGTNDGLRILDLADPVQPRDVGAWKTRYTHDSFVRGDRAYFCNISGGGFTTADVTDRAHPREIQFVQYDNAATHNAWTSTNGRVLYTTDENEGGHLRIWSVSDVGIASPAGEWAANPSAIIHNVTVRGDSAYIAYYTEGLQVVDITRPSSPLLVASYDTYPGVSGGFRGNWGVYPYARSGNIYLSDIQSGLFVVRLGSGGMPILDFRVHAPASQVAQPGQSQVLFFFDIFNGAGSAQTFDLTATNSAGWVLQAPAVLTVPRTGTEPILVRIDVPQQLVGPARVDVELCARSRASNRQGCERTRLAVPVVLQAFTTDSTPRGVALRWQLARDGGESGALVVQRALVGSPAFEERARLDIEAVEWLDEDVVPGVEYVYRLELAGDAGTMFLGESRAAASATRLHGTDPNPFSEQTALRFDLAQAGGARVAIFDTRGRRVREIVRRDLRPGRQAIVWDGAGTDGRRLPNGVYLYEIATRAGVLRGRMTLAR